MELAPLLWACAEAEHRGSKRVRQRRLLTSRQLGSKRERERDRKGLGTSDEGTLSVTCFLQLGSIP
jgi:hypothetical protein